jgi:hypothetical protein
MNGARARAANQFELMREEDGGPRMTRWDHAMRDVSSA